MPASTRRPAHGSWSGPVRRVERTSFGCGTRGTGFPPMCAIRSSRGFIGWTIPTGAVSGGPALGWRWSRKSCPPMGGGSGWRARKGRGAPSSVPCRSATAAVSRGKTNPDKQDKCVNEAIFCQKSAEITSNLLRRFEEQVIHVIRRGRLPCQLPHLGNHHRLLEGEQLPG